MNGEEPRQELQKLAELRHKLLEAYDPSQDAESENQIWAIERLLERRGGE
jgi:hypothetical protein